MPSFNKVIVAGHLSRDPELRYTPKGTPVARLALGVNHTWKTAAGEKKEEVSFVDCVAFGKQAETLGQYMKKGSPLLLEGRFRQETWQDKQTGKNRSKIVTVIEGFTFLGGKKDEQPAKRSGRVPATPQGPSEDEIPPTETDDVPF